MNAAIRPLRLAHPVLLALCALGIAIGAAAQSGNIAINASGAPADPKALLDLSSVTKGLLVPRMASLPGGALPSGLVAFKTGGSSGFYVYENGGWIPLLAGGKHGWDLYGNTLNDATYTNPDFIGTTDSRPMYFRTNNLHRMRIDGGTGFLGVGYPVAAPLAVERLDINGQLSMYYVPGGTTPISLTNKPGVFRYQTFGNLTGTAPYRYGSNELMATNPSDALTNNAVLGSNNSYALQYAAHWGNIGDSAIVQGKRVPTVVQPKTYGWRAFENPYVEERGVWNHFREAVCTTVDAEVTIPLVGPFYDSNILPIPERYLVTPFYGLGAPYTRHQYLFRASELNLELSGSTGGLCPGGEVKRISFYANGTGTRPIDPGVGATITVRNAPPGVNELLGFDNTVDASGTRGCAQLAPSSPWPPTAATGWVDIPLNVSSFFWDGTSNVIVEVAVRSTPPPASSTRGVVSALTSFNATYGAYSTGPPSPAILLPDPGAPGWSCDNSTNVMTRMPDAAASPYQGGSSMYRPRMKFFGTVANQDPPGSTTGTGPYLTYNGALILEDTVTARTDIPWGRWRPGTPTFNTFWSYQGKGTISAQHGVFDNTTNLNDHVFDRAFDGRVAPGDAEKHGGQRLLSIREMEAFTRANRHLPTMKGRADWNAEGGFSLGDLTNQLWATTEVQSLYVAELHDKLNVIEMLTNERPITREEFGTARHLLADMAQYTDAEKARLIAALRKRAPLDPPSR
jgi:hypothetical protein